MTSRGSGDQRMWDELASLRDDPDMLALKDQAVAQLLEQRKRRRSVLRVGAMAASLATVAVLGWLGFASLRGAAELVVLRTDRDAQREFRLEDGSLVTLSADTVIEVRLGRQLRDIKVGHGSVMFDVAHDASRPFVVRLGDSSVTALGTQFQTQRYANEVDVTLVEGSIRVARKNFDEAQLLQPGQRAAFTDSARGMTVENVDVDIATSWTHGWLKFRSTPLAQVVESVNRYSSGTLRLEDPALGTLQLSGDFRIGHTASMVAAMSALLPVRVEERDGEHLIRHAEPPSR